MALRTFRGELLVFLRLLYSIAAFDVETKASLKNDFLGEMIPVVATSKMHDRSSTDPVSGLERVLFAHLFRNYDPLTRAVRQELLFWPTNHTGDTPNPSEPSPLLMRLQQLWANEQVPDEQRLMERLLSRYDTSARPVFDASHNVTVKFAFTLTQIVDVDEVNQVLTTNVWLEQEWDDERLVWNESDYNGLSTLRIPCERIWLPDIVLYNNADDYTTGYMQSKAMVKSNGSVFWPPPAKFRSSCKIDITFFPFDDQFCTMKFGSWTYDGFQVDLKNRSETVSMLHYVESGEWELLDIRIDRNEQKYECCPEPYPDVTFTIIIRRRILYYLFNIVLPCLWLTILCLLGFWLPPECGEKVSLGITVLLAFSVFMLLVAESMPQTSEFVPLIGIFLTITMGMTSMSIVSTVIVLNLHHVTLFRNPVPRWIRVLFFDIIASAICLTGDIERANRYHRAKISQVVHKLVHSRAQAAKLAFHGLPNDGPSAIGSANNHIGDRRLPQRSFGRAVSNSPPEVNSRLRNSPKLN